MHETIVDLIRHGEPTGGSKYRGHTIDDPLSEKGWQQMWSATGNVASETGIPWQAIISSPMLRCSEFARLLGEKHGVPVTIDDRLKEIGFGSWEGKTRADIRQQNLKEYDDFYRDPVGCRPPGAEDLDEFIKRTCLAFDDVVQQNAGRHCLIVTHAGVIRSVLAYMLGAGHESLYRIDVMNAGLSRVSCKPGQMRLVFVNRTGLS